MNPIIEASLKKSISYNEYRKMVETLVDKKSTTGDEKTDALVEYTRLNDRRMKRWDKTVKLSDEVKDTIMQFEDPVTWLVITESWCGDAAHVVPVVNKVAELNKNIDLRLVMRDENEELMNLFLTNGSRSIPMLIMISNTTKEVITTYGPRPTEITKIVDDYKRINGKLTNEFKEDLQYWYNKNKGQGILDDLSEILTEIMV